MLLLNAHAPRPRIAPREGQATSEPFKHDDWRALVTRFVVNGQVDYPNLRRVRRLVEAYLSRLSDPKPDAFEHGDAQLAFYLNAFNAIAVYQALLHYPVASLRAVPAAWTRPFPVGPENLSLHGLLHTKIRAWRDPRVHAAVVPAAVSAPQLRAYSAMGLQQELDAQMRAFLADPARGLCLDQASQSVALSQVFRWFAGDFVGDPRTPALFTTVRGLLKPSIAVPSLLPYVPPDAATALRAPGALVTFLPYNSALNGPRE